MHRYVTAALNTLRPRGRALVFAVLFCLLPIPALADEGHVVMHFSPLDTGLLVCALVLGLIAVGVAIVVGSMVHKEPSGSEKMQEVGKAIREGAVAYLRKQVQTMAIFVVLIAIGLFALFFDKSDPKIAI